MEKATLVAKYAQTEEDKLVLSRVLDRICQGVARQIPTATEFLTARERILAEQMLQAADMGPVRFSGGLNSCGDNVFQRFSIHIYLLN